MRKFTLILVVCFALLSSSVYAQKAITGKVVDEDGLGMPGVTVVQKGTTKGTVTDTDGNYSVTVATGAMLRFSFMGMQTVDESVSGRSVIDVTMKTDAIGLEGVVAVGYGVQKKENLTGAVSSVSFDKAIGDRPITNISDGLQGQVPGLMIQGTNFEPGSSSTFNIRGYTSINGGSPLILVDNVPIDDISTLNPEDIKSVSVLKDAASSAIYGARAAFGVILISTKKSSKESELTINYNNNFGFTNARNTPGLANPLQSVQLYKVANGSDNRGYWTGQDIDTWIDAIQDYNQNPSKYPDGTTEIDGTKYYMRESNPIGSLFENSFKQTHNISAYGGSKKTSYRISMGYLDYDGVLYGNKDTYDRLTLSSYINMDIKKWLTQEIDVKYTKSKKVYADGNFFTWGLTDASWTPVGGTEVDGQYYDYRTTQNYINEEVPTKRIRESPRIFTKTMFKPTKGLDVVFEYTYEKRNFDYTDYDNTFYLYDVTESGLEEQNSKDWYEHNAGQYNRNAINAYATYSRTFAQKHNTKFMMGYNQESYNSTEVQSKVLDQINPNIPSISQGTGEIRSYDPSAEYSVRGTFFRLNYDYQGKYLFEVNGRYDGSSKFPKDSRFAFFPSFSAGYRISEEMFMNSAEWLNNLKLRGSWGEVGNQFIGNYDYIPTMGSSLAGWIYNGERPTTLSPPGLVSPSFTWETVATLDVGIDFSMFDSRLSGVFDWYRRTTKGMLTRGETLPSIIGTSSPKENAANLEVKGWEMSLTWQDKIKDFSYSVGFNLYDNKPVITKFANEAGLISDFHEGVEINNIWGYVSDGYYTDDDFNDDGSLKGGLPKPEGIANLYPGDMKYKDLNGDGYITDGSSTYNDPGDRKVIGNSTPRYQYGINLSAGWKGFTFSAFLQGVGQRDHWIMDDKVLWPGSSFQPAILTSVLDYWTPENADSYFPRMYYEGGGNTSYNRREQTKYLTNTAYLRLKNITLGYNFPKRITSKLGVKNLRVFASFENLCVWDNMPDGIDAEIRDFKYPYTGTNSFGLNVTF
ncbi:MAG: SusC/RagA family TonB-linked outer membrane protein [Bacteroidales bacterium]